MAKALVYGTMAPSSILAPFIDFLFFSPLYSGNFLSWERVSVYNAAPIFNIADGHRRALLMQW